MNIELDKLGAKPNETIRQHTDKLIEQAELLHKLGLVKSEDMFSDLLTACEYHDYGKANSEFQKRLYNHHKFNSEREIPHSVLSVFYVDEEKCIDYTSVCFAVLYHHYNGESPITLLWDKEELIRKFLNEISEDGDLYDEIYDCADVIGDLFGMTLDTPKKQYAALLKGFLHKCDYSASAGIDCEKANDFLDSSLEKWKTDNNIAYNSLQEFCRENRNNDIVVTAPTGMGKTEAGLMWCGDNKCFFVLPLKTAINAMYKRLKSLSGPNYKDRIALIHSDMKSEYKHTNAVNESGEFDFDYCIRSRQMSLPITVCTPDQIFDFVLKYPGYEYKLVTTSYSKFIVDEIQMYSPDLLAAIIHAIDTIHKLGGKFAVLTATLPPFVKKELKKIFGEEAVFGDFSYDGKLRHNVKVTEDTMNSEFIYDTVQRVKTDEVKKFLVVCNSIDTADRIYTELFEMCNGENIEVNLFHAGFTKNDRAQKEAAILAASSDNTKTEIWISTSVVEASLDIDFDILFTELSDLFSLFQRFGRVNRKGEKEHSQYNCFVFTELQGNAKKYHFTDDTIHTLSKQAIMTVDGVVSEEDKSRLIEKYLSVENIESSAYYKEYLDARRYYSEKLDYLDGKNDGLRKIDRVDAIPKDVYEENISIIKDSESVMNSSNSTNEARLNANEVIMGFTVSVSRYNMKKHRTNEYVNLRYNSISVIDCKYTYDRGIVFSSDNDSNDIDNMI